MASILITFNYPFMKEQDPCLTFLKTWRDFDSRRVWQQLLLERFPGAIELCFSHY